MGNRLSYFRPNYRDKVHRGQSRERVFALVCVCVCVCRERGGVSLVPRPSLAPVFDRLQYAKTEPEQRRSDIACSHT